LAGRRLAPVSRKLRGNPTEAQKRLWWRRRSRQLGVQFTREFAIGNAIVDFACRRLKLVIELDGEQHSDSTTDEDRTRLIEAHGYHVIRFWNHDVLQNTDGVLQTIVAEIELARNRS
jgi:BirA family biotin operon repressor/biotin-[acetyl-CoA-carboxylase] ligase